MRSAKEIAAELEAFRAQFYVTLGSIPAGTPDRKNIYRRRVAEVNAARYAPANRQRERALSEELCAAQRRERAVRSARQRAADPQYAERQRIFRELRKMGFVREHTSGRSAYYTRRSLTVRVSDHEVPLSDERRYNLNCGGRSWANSRWSFVVDGDRDADEWLSEVRDEVALRS